MITKNTLIYLKEELTLNNLSHLLPIIDNIEVELKLSDQNSEQEHALTKANEAMDEFWKKITEENKDDKYRPVIQESNFRNGGINDDPGPRSPLRKRRKIDK